MSQVSSLRRGPDAKADGRGSVIGPGLGAGAEDQAHIDRLQRFIFDGTSRLTRLFPRAGSRLLGLTFGGIAASPLLGAVFNRHNRRVVRGRDSLRKFLIVPDIHIGDAIMAQAALTAVRDFFPEARVDFVVNRSVYPLVEGNPEASWVIPLFNGGLFPTVGNIAALGHLIESRRYDLVLNFCPYIKAKDFPGNGAGVLNFLSRAPLIVRNEGRPSPVNHFADHMYRFVRELLSLAAEPVRSEPFRGVDLYLNDSAMDEAWAFASEAGLSPGRPIVLFNPDASSTLTLMPFDAQLSLLEALTRLKAEVLLGESISEAGRGLRLKASLPRPARERVTIVPAHLSLEGYTALVDLCDVFISADTGPLHIAAARRVSRTGRSEFRNRTAVLSYFGATPARMSGYDSQRPGYLPANQDAPSWAYTAESPCRNVTCLNKMYKTCRALRCFDRVDIEGLVGRVASHIASLSCRPALSRHRRAA